MKFQRATNMKQMEEKGEFGALFLQHLVSMIVYFQDGFKIVLFNTTLINLVISLLLNCEEQRNDVFEIMVVHVFGLNAK